MKDKFLRDLTRSLKGVAVHTGGIDRAQTHLDDAHRAEVAGDLVGAANALRLAIAVAAERMDIQEAYDRVASALAVTMADGHEKRAKEEEAQDSWQEAALSWVKVCDGRPDDAPPHIRAAEAMLKADLPLSDAKRFAQRAAEIEPENPAVHRLLAQIFIEAGMKVNARKALEKAAKLDPKDELVKNLLKELK
ncbi:MAG: tetratricopeptide repeat protein [Myxococcales bacterium]|nr:tetratricopeptide repeat protein [Myxococcales bacterium]